jgi:hypothetical protein
LIVTVAAEATLADASQQLGRISPRKVRCNPPLANATEKDVIRIRARERRLFGLVHGVLVEKVMGYWESVLALEKGRLLGVSSVAAGERVGREGHVQHQHLKVLARPERVEAGLVLQRLEAA